MVTVLILPEAGCFPGWHTQSCFRCLLHAEELLQGHGQVQRRSQGEERSDIPAGAHPRPAECERQHTAPRGGRKRSEQSFFPILF